MVFQKAAFQLDECVGCVDGACGHLTGTVNRADQHYQYGSDCTLGIDPDVGEQSVVETCGTGYVQRLVY